MSNEANQSRPGQAGGNRTLRNFFWLALPHTALVALVFALFYHVLVVRHVRDFVRQQQGELRQCLAQVETNIDDVVTDLDFLSRSPFVADCLTGDTEARDKLQNSFMNFCEAKKRYFQIRAMGLDGHGDVCVDFDGKEATSQTGRKAEAHGHREATTLHPGAFAVSPLELNVQKGGEVKLPWQPSIRLAKPVFDKSGRKIGVLSLNFSADNTLRLIKGPIHLTNSDGYWLKGGPPESQWAFMFKRKEGFFSRFPTEWRAMRDVTQGVVETDNGVFIHLTAAPFPQNKTAGAWKMILHYDNLLKASGADKTAASLLLIFGLVMAGSLGANLYLAYLLNNRRQKQLELRQSNERLAAANREERATLERLHYASKAKSDFIANISHEIRTPLNAIQGFADLLAKSSDPLEKQQYLDSIMGSSKSLLTLINDILAMSKADAGKLAVELKPMRLGEVFRELKSIFAPKVNAKGLVFTAVLEPNVPAALHLDKNLLRQALFNLVGNAIKFTERGHVLLAAAASEPGPDGRLELSVRVEDTGSGIPPDQLEDVFKPFEKGKTQLLTPGAGLGLPITKRLIELMGGELSVRSAENQGSCFTATFKRVEPGTEEEETMLRLLSVQEPEPPPPPRLLLAGTTAKRRELKELLSTEFELELIEADRLAEDAEADVIVAFNSAVPADMDWTVDKFHRVPIVLLLDDYHSHNGPAAPPFANMKFVHERDLEALKKTLRNLLYQGGAKPCQEEPPKAEARAALAKELRRELENDFRTFAKAPMINKIGDFAGRLAELGKQYRSAELTSYAAELQTGIATFEVDKIQLSLAAFPEIVERHTKIGAGS